MVACAEWVKRKFESLGFTASVEETGATPPWSRVLPTSRAVKPYSSTATTTSSPRTPRRMGYPPSNPISAMSASTPAVRPIIRARSSPTSSASANCWPATGQLPVNVIFLVEGEEEIAQRTSRRLPGKAPRFPGLRHSSSFPTPAWPAHGYPTLTYSFAGSPRWNSRCAAPPRSPPGVFGGAVMNPATAAARLIATLHDESGKVAIEGFYDDVAPLEAWEREAAAALPHHRGRPSRLTGVQALGEAGYSAIERTAHGPPPKSTASAAVIRAKAPRPSCPRKAFAKLTFRLVPNRNPERSSPRRGPSSGETLPARRHAGNRPRPLWRTHYVNSAQPGRQAAARAGTAGRKPALLREGGSIPIVTTGKVLGADSPLLALAVARSPGDTRPTKTSPSKISRRHPPEPGRAGGTRENLNLLPPPFAARLLEICPNKSPVSGSCTPPVLIGASGHL